MQPEEPRPAVAAASPPAPPPIPAPEDLATRPPWAPPEALRPPALFGPDADDEYPGEESLTGAGAFDSAPRSRLGAFDPGRRGVKALAAVAILVVVIAALLAWRARPRVDPVAPPGIDPAAADASLADDSDDSDAAGPATSAPAGPGAKPSSPAAVVVAVGGKVRKPGLVELPPGARVADALQAAGGASPGVDVAPLNLARKVADGELIMVGVTPPPGAAPTGAAGPAAPGQPGAGPINLNTATLADLDTLPGVGPVLAQRILEARDAQGGFKAVSDLRQVSGIGAARYEQLKDLVTV
ncbi:helix-hairpin-helix domain-containing protein [Actinoplanes sp. CA-051413]|uniref:helix-hairpin-helix domain-containing protein n=1 Tax=Actinoplanes sp. CA-051413 TaxID=3239899 RepID=UPI003D98026A